MPRTAQGPKGIARANREDQAIIKALEFYRKHPEGLSKEIRKNNPELSEDLLGKRIDRIRGDYGGMIVVINRRMKLREVGSAPKRQEFFLSDEELAELERKEAEAAEQEQDAEFSAT